MTIIRDGVSSHDFANALTVSLPMNEHHTDSTDHQHKHMEQPTVEDRSPDIDILEQLMSKTNLDLAGIDRSESLTASPGVDFLSGTQSIPDMFFRDVPWNALGPSTYTHPEALSKLHDAIELTAASHAPKRSTRKPSKRGRANIISETESTKSYVTANTSSTATYFTASSTLEGGRNNGMDNRPALPQIVEKLPRSSWYDHLEGRGMIPNPLDEQNWSGRGQHAEFKPDEVDLVPLKAERILGTTANAVVESVMCRRIRLARKTIKCGRHMKREDAVTEVEHLQRLSHFHLIQVIGTYIMGEDLSILLYPVTEYNLETFIDSIIEPKNTSKEVIDPALDPLSEASHRKCFHLFIFIGCLSNALRYLHANVTKHMDIKPKNLLVRQIAKDSSFWCTYRIYIADFGIARAYQSIADSETDSPTFCTRLYAAPEVIEGKRRGLSADIFSLGCVFLEILATIGWYLSGQDMLLELKYLRTKNTNGYQANIPDVQAWLSHFNDLVGKSLSSISSVAKYASFANERHKRFPSEVALPKLIQWMLEPDPSLRPSAFGVAELTSLLCCYRCNTEREKFEAV